MTGAHIVSDPAAARTALDAHVRDIVNWHFDPATGSPFWLEYARKLGWDPRREIGGFAELGKLGAFEDEWLRGGPVQRWIPKGLAGKPVFVFETGGTTGIPKTRVAFEDFRTDYELFSDTLPEEYFPRGSNWLMLGPSGPRRLRLSVEHLAQYRGGICFCVDLDPRWVIKLITSRRTKRTSSSRRSPSCRRATTSAACSPRRSCSNRSRCAWKRWARRSARWGSRGSSRAGRSSPRSGTASRTRNCSTAPT
jgi:hypothetical protein